MPTLMRCPSSPAIRAATPGSSSAVVAVSRPAMPLRMAASSRALVALEDDVKRSRTT
jgi:hypothetical protein